MATAVDRALLESLDPIERVLFRGRLWVWVTGGLVVVAIGAALLASVGSPTQAMNSVPWRRVPLPPALLFWTLALHGWRQRAYVRAVAAIGTIRADGAAPVEAALRAPVPHALRRRIIAFVLALLSWFFVTQAWTSWPQGIGILSRVISLGLLVLFAAVAGIVVDTAIHRDAVIRRLLSGPLKPDVLDTSPFGTIASWPVPLCVTAIGLISLVVVFYPDPIERLPGSVLFPAGILVSLSLLADALLRTHSIMKRTRRAELETVRQRLRTAFDLLKEASRDRNPAELVAEGSAVSAWLECERRIAAAPQWPYNAETLRTLVASIIVPVAIGVVETLHPFGV